VAARVNQLLMTKAIISDFSGVILQLDLRGEAVLNQGLLSWYKQLSQKYILALFTNAISFRFPPIKLQLDDIFSHYYLSSEIGFSKSDSEAYTWIANDLKIEPSEMVFIDDTKKNIDAAQQAGLRAFLYSSNKQIKGVLE